MLIQKAPNLKHSAQTSQRLTLSQNAPENEPNATLDGFYKGADIGAGLLIGAGVTMTSMSVVGAGLYGLFNDSGVGVAGGLFLGGPLGVGLGYLADKGLDKLGAALDQSSPQRGAALTKTAVLGAGSLLLGDGLGDAVSTLGMVGAAGGIGAGYGYFTQK